jgi:hypothetical protein
MPACCRIMPTSLLISLRHFADLLQRHADFVAAFMPTYFMSLRHHANK